MRPALLVVLVVVVVVVVLVLLLLLLLLLLLSSLLMVQLPWQPFHPQRADATPCRGLRWQVVASKFKHGSKAQQKALDRARSASSSGSVRADASSVLCACITGLSARGCTSH